MEKKETQKKREKDLTLEMKTTHKLLKTQVQKIVIIKIYSNVSLHIQNEMYHTQITYKYKLYMHYRHFRTT